MSPKKAPANAGSGSPPAGEPVHLVVGYLRRPHGVRGEMLMDVHTDFPDRLKAGVKVYIGDARTPMILAGQRVHSEGILIAFEGLGAREDVERYCNQWVYVSVADRPPLPEGHYYHHQLIGLQVVDEKGESLGEVTDILETGANDVYVVTRPDGHELLLPAIASVITEINLGGRQMRVHLLPGLLDEEV